MMKNIKMLGTMIMVIVMLWPFLTSAQTIVEEPIEQEGIFAGYHLGIVQPLYSIQNSRILHLFGYNDYAVGLAIGLSLNTPGSAIIDLEFVSFISQLPDEGVDLKVHLLYHPGVLVPLGQGFTLGVRMAFETGQGKWGFTPLLNKSFVMGSSRLFLEMVAPGRFGPGQGSKYSQVLGIHAGIAF